MFEWLQDVQDTVVNIYNYFTGSVGGIRQKRPSEEISHAAVKKRKLSIETTNMEGPKGVIEVIDLCDDDEEESNQDIQTSFSFRLPLDKSMEKENSVPGKCKNNYFSMMLKTPQTGSSGKFATLNTMKEIFDSQQGNALIRSVKRNVNPFVSRIQMSEHDMRLNNIKNDTLPSKYLQVVKPNPNLAKSLKASSKGRQSAPFAPLITDEDERLVIEMEMKEKIVVPKKSFCAPDLDTTILKFQNIFCANKRILEEKERANEREKKEFSDTIFNDLINKLRFTEPEKVPLPTIDDFKESIRELKRQKAGQKSLETLNVKISSLNTLSPYQWLDDEVINGYMLMITNRSQREGYEKAHCFSTFFYASNLAAPGRGYSLVRRWTKKVDIFACRWVIAPIHVGRNHWCLCCLDLREKIATYYDSLRGQNTACLQRMLQYLDEECMDKKKRHYSVDGWETRHAEDIPRQMNGYDCGVFACTYAEHITRNVPFDFTQEEMPHYRLKMQYELLREELMF